MRNVLNVLSIIAVISLSSCGGGDTSSGSGKDKVASDCIEGKQFRGSSPVHSIAEFTNSCSYDVNVRSVLGGDVHTISANSTRRNIPWSFGGVAACRAPSTPIVKSGRFEGCT